MAEQAWPGALVNGAVLALAAAAACWAERPRGWADSRLLEVRTSSVPGAGRGVFCRAGVPSGAVLGAYPGRVRSPAQVLAKVATAPRTRDYVLLVPELPQPRYLDPTDASGCPSAWPGPGLPWLLQADPTLAFMNEPPAGGDVNVCFGEALRGDPLEVRFVAARQLEAGQELFIDYGRAYNRSSYA
ncbi:hypothetical protein WJX81_002141 [Elliptochloris bilobata]|uniref:SET domain-containing protein n=1 Tax=Elliptochloris bilobata TaxID=381761 RepID=A0AAW1SF08_9CHLO